eukprot:2601909-Pleurochrysis_carterae.AAC.1
MKPRWSALPAAWQHRPSSQPASFAGFGVSASLENLALNPVTGPGRSAADVQRELNALQAGGRREAADSAYIL